MVVLLNSAGGLYVGFSKETNGIKAEVIPFIELKKKISLHTGKT